VRLNSFIAKKNSTVENNIIVFYCYFCQVIENFASFVLAL